MSQKEKGKKGTKKEPNSTAKANHDNKNKNENEAVSTNSDAAIVNKTNKAKEKGGTTQSEEGGTTTNKNKQNNHEEEVNLLADLDTFLKLQEDSANAGHASAAATVGKAKTNNTATSGTSAPATTTAAAATNTAATSATARTTTTTTTTTASASAQTKAAPRTFSRGNRGTALVTDGLANSKVRQILQHATINDVVVITWRIRHGQDHALNENVQQLTAEGRVSRLPTSADDRWRINYPNSPELNRTSTYPLPFNEDANTILDSIVLAPTNTFDSLNLGLPPCDRSSSRTEVFNARQPDGVFFVDGSYYPANKNAAAAVVYRKRQQGVRMWNISEKKIRDDDEQHGRYYQNVSQHAAEFSAMIAMFTLAKNKPPDSFYIGIVDSNLVFDAVQNNNNTFKAPHIKELVDKARLAWLDVHNKFVIMCMDRKYGNPADSVAKNVANTHTGIGSQDIFVDLHVPANKFTMNSEHQRRMLEEQGRNSCYSRRVNEVAKDIDDVHKFAQLYKYHALSSCPAPCRLSWSNVVAQQVQAVIDAPDENERSTAFIGLMILPQLFLPSNATKQALEQHLLEGRVFNMELLSVDELRHQEKEQQEQKRKKQQELDQHLDDTQRAARDQHRQERKNVKLADTVQRLFNDNKVKQARKVLQNESESKRLEFSEMTERLKTKFVDQRQPFNNDVHIKDIPLTMPFGGGAVVDVLKNMPKQAATCIDRWTPQLMLQAIETNQNICAGLGSIAAMVLNRQFNTQVRDFFTLARGLGIPKDDDGIRPIQLSSFFAKFTGSLAYGQASPSLSKRQYAVRAAINGCHSIIHKVREKYKEGKAVIRIDVSNAFGTAMRALVERLLRDHDRKKKGAWSALRRFFDIMYKDPSFIALYGNGCKDILFIKFLEGLRQGDVVASFFFNLIMDAVMDRIEELRDEDPELQGVDIDLLSFIDDLTAVTEPQHAVRVTKIIVQALGEHGFKVNINKSKILCRNQLSTDSNNNIAVVSCTDAAGAVQQMDITTGEDESFVVLGGNISDNYESYNFKQRQKFNDFFNLLESVPLHPQVAFTIARLCGAPKLQYYCTVTPPEHARDVVAEFHQRMIKYVESPNVLDFSLDHDIKRNAQTLSSTNEVINVAVASMQKQVQQSNNNNNNDDDDNRDDDTDTTNNHEARLDDDGARPRRSAAEIEQNNNENSSTASVENDNTTARPCFDNMKFLRHERRGLGLPNYPDYHHLLYQHSRNACMRKCAAPAPALVTNFSEEAYADHDPLTLHLRAQQQAEWLFFTSPNKRNHLFPNEFRLAAAIRCGVLPNSYVDRLVTCHCPGCGVITQTHLDVINHALTCPRASSYTSAHRHTLLKYAVAAVCRDHGVNVVVEPNFYEYNNEKLQRPDLTVMSVPPIATDFTVVRQVGEVGKHAAAAAEQKKKTHEDAVHRMTHIFEPFAAEAHGTLDPSCVRFCNKASQGLQIHMQRSFKREMYMAVSCSLAKARAAMLSNLMFRNMQETLVGVKFVKTTTEKTEKSKASRNSNSLNSPSLKRNENPQSTLQRKSASS
jgi:hypothetical protein